MVTFPRDSRSKAKVFCRPRACRHGREEASQAAACAKTETRKMLLPPRSAEIGNWPLLRSKCVHRNHP